jgi:hypothetical protein
MAMRSQRIGAGVAGPRRPAARCPAARGSDRQGRAPCPRVRAWQLWTAAALSAAVASCGDGASPASNLEASLRLSGAGVQYVPGPLVDDPTAVGPAVHAVSAAFHVFPGAIGRSVGGTVEAGSAAVLVGLDGDVGHYVIPISGADLDNPPDLVFAAQASFAKTLGVGPASLRARAVAANGSVGPGASQGLSVDAAPVAGTLVVSLTWDTEADLDLHVVTPPSMPDGKPVELWSGNRTTLLPRSALEGGPYTDEELATAGVLDFDSNSQCLIDGALAENVSWQVPPPAGHYIVRVDTFSMCGQPAARWTLTVTLDGTPLGTFAGLSTESDTRFAHKAGAGLTVFEFDL